MDVRVDHAGLCVECGHSFYPCASLEREPAAALETKASEFGAKFLGDKSLSLLASLFSH